MSWASRLTCKEHKESLRCCSAFRRLISAAQAIAEDAWRAVGDPDAAIARSIARLVAIRRGLPQDLVTPAEWAAATQHALEEGLPLELLGLSTGLRELDVALLGLVPSELYVLGARTSAGKTRCSCRWHTTWRLITARCCLSLWR